MKIILSTLIMLVMSIQTFCQTTNHVLNYDFETYTQCPNAYSQTDRCTGWRSFTGGTSDYYNTCGVGSQVFIPSNGFGYQHAASGNGYVGGVVYGGNNYREYIAREITPLVAKSVYEVSMYVSLANLSGYATNNIGAFFHDSALTYTNSNFIDVDPQVLYTNYAPINDTSNWVRLRKKFYADSAYDNIVIGGFLAPNLVTKVPTGVNLTTSYYYFDSIVVRPTSGIFISDVDSVLCASDSFDLEYFAAGDFVSTNTFIAQLSNKNGSFSSPINIGTLVKDTSGVIRCGLPNNTSPGYGYRIRVVSSNIVDTSFEENLFVGIGNLDSAGIQVSNNTLMCEGGNINFIVTHNASIISFNWTGPNGFTSIAQNPIITNISTANSGVYYSEIKSYGCIKRDTLDVQVKPNPSLPAVGSNSTVCAGDTLYLTASSTSGATYTWTGPNMFQSNVQNPYIANCNVSNSGTYTVTANLDGCTRYGSGSVSVVAAPENISAGSNTPLCSGDEVKLNASNTTSGVSYSWTGPNSFTSSSQNPTMSNATTMHTGAYIATFSLNGCVEKDTVYVAVNPIPAVPTLSYNPPLCVGDQLSLTSSSTTSGISYSWSGSNGFTGNIQNPNRANISLADTGDYTLITTRLNCSSAPALINVEINPKPFVVITTNADTICKDETITLNALVNNTSSSLQYQWYINAQPIIGSNVNALQTNQIQDGDEVYCVLTDNAKCSTPVSDLSNDLKFTVLPWLAPSVTISVSPQGPVHQDSFLTFTATVVDAGIPTYQWKRNGNDIVGAWGQTWAAKTLKNRDTICVEIESGYRCPRPRTAKSNCIAAQILSVDDISHLNNIKIYPNPNGGKFVIEAQTSGTSEYSINIFNALGKEVYNTHTHATSGRLYKEVNLGRLAAGVYLLNIRDIKTGNASTARLMID